MKIIETKTLQIVYKSLVICKISFESNCKRKAKIRGVTFVKHSITSYSMPLLVRATVEGGVNSEFLKVASQNVWLPITTSREKIFLTLIF